MFNLEYKKYNLKYPKFFSNEKKILEYNIKRNVKIIHIGSTAIYGLGGKEIIDIMIVNNNNNNLDEIKAMLIYLDYNHHENLSFGNRIFFSKDKNKNKDNIRIHLHLTCKDSADYEKAVFFKKFLLNNKESAKHYQSFKQKTIRETGGDYSKYRQIKNKYIDEIFKSI